MIVELLSPLCDSLHSISKLHNLEINFEREEYSGFKYMSLLYSDLFCLMLYW